MYRTISLEYLDYPSNVQVICMIFKYYVSAVTRPVSCFIGLQFRIALDLPCRVMSHKRVALPMVYEIYMTPRLVTILENIPRKNLELLITIVIANK